MDMEIFRKHEYDLFDDDSMFIQYSNDPTHFMPPIGYIPRPIEQTLSQEPWLSGNPSNTNKSPSQEANYLNNGNHESHHQKRFIASEYEIDLASRAYDKLYANREFSFHGMKADLVQEYLTRWKWWTNEVLEHESFYESLIQDWEQDGSDVERKNTFRREFELHDSAMDKLGIHDFAIDKLEADEVEIDEFEMDEIGMDDIPAWSGSSESKAEDIAWKLRFANRKFDIDELRPEIRMIEIARWRAEIVKLNKEDHQRFGPEQTVDALNELLSKESDQGEFKAISYNGMNKLLEKLEKSLSLEIEIADEKKSAPKVDFEILDIIPGLDSLEVREDPQADFGRILLGEESHILFSDTERGLTPGNGRYEWERVDESDKSDDRFGHNKPNERDEQERNDEHGEHDGHSR